MNERFVKDGEHVFDRDTIDYVATGKKLRLGRKNSACPIIDAAHYLEKTVQSVYGYEQGKTAITLRDFVCLCSLYQIHPDDVICMKKETGKWREYEE